MERSLYEADHEAYRETVREFLAREVEPHKDKWDDEKWIDREVFARAAKTGIYAHRFPSGTAVRANPTTGTEWWCARRSHGSTRCRSG